MLKIALIFSTLTLLTSNVSLASEKNDKKELEVKDEKPICRCGDSNGACELKPALEANKDKNLDPIKISKTKDQAYHLTETTRLLKQNADVFFTQGGCDHTFYEFRFILKDKPSLKLNNYQAQISKLTSLLDAINNDYAKEMSEALKKALANNLRGPTQEKLCQQHEAPNNKVYCIVGIQQYFSWLSVEIEKSNNGKIIYKATEVLAL